MSIALTPPQSPETGVLFAVPHAGRSYPPALFAGAQLGARDLRRLEDPWVDALTEGVGSHGAWTLRTEWARAVADVNRAANELDPSAVAGFGASALNRTAKARVGLGVVPTRMGTCLIYRKALSRFEVEQRLNLAYRPYHERLRTALEDLSTRHPELVLVDCHSMPESAQNKPGEPVDVAIGDFHGRSASSWLIDAIEEMVGAHGFRVARNRPYAGGYVTEHYGRPERGWHVVQIEIRRQLYLREERMTRHRGGARVSALFDALAATIGTMLRQRRIDPLAIAGE